MQIIKEEINTPKISNERLITNPTTIYASKILNKDTAIERSFLVEKHLNSSIKDSFSEMWGQQHPLIHTWLVLSSVSICFLTAFLFIMH